MSNLIKKIFMIAIMIVIPVNIAILFMIIATIYSAITKN